MIISDKDANLAVLDGLYLGLFESPIIQLNLYYILIYFKCENIISDHTHDHIVITLFLERPEVIDFLFKDEIPFMILLIWKLSLNNLPSFYSMFDI